ncbi:hypothetical protein ERJ75_001440400 [Trypanosoma vivax]|nr:hypothetical protein TRVL_04249 [Trypanosoma vivax]KAH8607186.1 hypothetical protein ERJ75_001440400 [Trypanosoma vivax]
MVEPVPSEETQMATDGVRAFKRFLWNLFLTHSRVPIEVESDGKSVRYLTKQGYQLIIDSLVSSGVLERWFPAQRDNVTQCEIGLFGSEQCRSAVWSAMILAGGRRSGVYDSNENSICALTNTEPAQVNVDDNSIDDLPSRARDGVEWCILSSVMLKYISSAPNAFFNESGTGLGGPEVGKVSGEVLSVKEVAPSDDTSATVGESDVLENTGSLCMNLSATRCQTSSKMDDATVDVKEPHSRSVMPTDCNCVSSVCGRTLDVDSSTVDAVYAALESETSVSEAPATSTPVQKHISPCIPEDAPVAVSHVSSNWDCPPRKLSLRSKTDTSFEKTHATMAQSPEESTGRRRAPALGATRQSKRAPTPPLTTVSVRRSSPPPRPRRSLLTSSSINLLRGPELGVAAAMTRQIPVAVDNGEPVLGVAQRREHPVFNITPPEICRLTRACLIDNATNSTKSTAIAADPLSRVPSRTNAGLLVRRADKRSSVAKVSSFCEEGSNNRAAVGHPVDGVADVSLDVITGSMDQDASNADISGSSVERTVVKALVSLETARQKDRDALSRYVAVHEEISEESSHKISQAETTTTYNAEKLPGSRGTIQSDDAPSLKLRGSKVESSPILWGEDRFTTASTMEERARSDMRLGVPTSSHVSEGQDAKKAGSPAPSLLPPHRQASTSEQVELPKTLKSRLTCNVKTLAGRIPNSGMEAAPSQVTGRPPPPRSPSQRALSCFKNNRGSMMVAPTIPLTRCLSANKLSDKRTTTT